MAVIIAVNSETNNYVIVLPTLSKNLRIYEH